MDTHGTSEPSERRSDLAALVYRRLPNFDALRTLLRHVKLSGIHVPTLAGVSFKAETVLRVVQAVGVELLLEHERVAKDRAVEQQTEKFISMLDRLEEHAKEREAFKYDSTERLRKNLPSAGFASGQVDDTTFVVVGRMAIQLYTHDTFDTYLHCGDGSQKYLWRVVEIGADNSTNVIERDFLSLEEAVAAFPDAAITRQPSE